MAIRPLAELIRDRLDQRGWGLRDLERQIRSIAEQGQLGRPGDTGVSISTLSDIMNKPGMTPDLSTLALLSVALELPLRDLIEACGYPLDGAGAAASRDARVAAIVGAVPVLRPFLEELVSLSEDDQEAVLAYLDALRLRRQKRQRS